MQVKNLVLLYDIKLDKRYNIKLFFKSLRLFKIREANDIKSFSILEEINKTTIKETYLENQLKRYVNREKIYQLFVELKNNNNNIKEKSVEEIEVSRSNLSNCKNIVRYRRASALEFGKVYNFD